MNEEMRLTITASQQMLLVARMALAGFCCQCGADVETLEDVRTLCDEACYCLMHQPRFARALRITAEKRGVRAFIRFEAEPGDMTGGAEPPYDPEIARGVLGALAPEVALEQGAEGVRAIGVAVHVAPL